MCLHRETFGSQPVSACFSRLPEGSPESEPGPTTTRSPCCCFLEVRQLRLAQTGKSTAVLGTEEQLPLPTHRVGVHPS